MFGLGPSEMIVIFVLLIVLFGARRLPELAKGLGKGLREFKSELQSINEPSSKNQQS